MLSIPTADVNKVMQHGSHVVDLTGSVSDSALIKDVQWDAFGTNVLHLDLARVDATEVVEVSLPIELKGEAPGTHEGGVINFSKHEIVIACPARSLPDKLILKINNLHLDQSLTAGDVPLPPGATCITAVEEPIVSCALPVEAPEVEDSDGASEPEVIGAKPKQEGDE